MGVIGDIQQAITDSVASEKRAFAPLMKPVIEANPDNSLFNDNYLPSATSGN